MEFRIEGPTPLELVSSKAEGNQLTLVPHTIKGSHILRVAYATAIGEGGAEVRAVLLFNANKGEFLLQRADQAPARFEFDRPADEFFARRARLRQQGAEYKRKSQEKSNNAAADKDVS